MTEKEKQKTRLEQAVLENSFIDDLILIHKKFNMEIDDQDRNTYVLINSNPRAYIDDMLNEYI